MLDGDREASEAPLATGIGNRCCLSESCRMLGLLFYENGARDSPGVSETQLRDVARLPYYSR